MQCGGFKMKKFKVFLALTVFVFANVVFGATLKLKSGNYELSKSNKIALSDSQAKVMYFIEVKDRKNLKKIQKEDVEFLNYMGHSIWLVKGRVSKISSYSNGLLKFDSSMKIASSLKTKNIENNKVSVYMVRNSGNKLFFKYLKDNDIKFEETSGRIDCILKDKNTLYMIAKHNSVMWVSEKEPEKVLNNVGAQEMSDVDSVQHAPYDLTGTGEIVGVWDGGEVFPHKEFGGRTTLKDYSAPADHATHVAGTIGSSGTFDSKSEGMATNVSIYSYDYSGDVNSELVNANNTYGIQISNHSWGWGHDVADGWDVERFGDYEAYSANQDAICYENNLIVVRSAGNSRDEFEFTKTIDPTSTSKNVITIGALYNEKQITSYSSWGPCDDGRVKPDICAKGGGGFFTSLMYSTLPNDSYGRMQGTSMAAPVVSGSMALILETYHRYNQGEIPAALAKGLILHTAEDLYNPGPDYMTGFGLMQVKTAVDFLIGSNYGEDNGFTIIRSVVDDGETKTYTFEVPEGSMVDRKVTACWADTAGSPSALKALVNDVDIKVISPEGTEYFPYVLNVNNPTADATKGVNSLDNVEQISFTPTTAGTWTIEVKGTDIDSLNIPEVYVFVNAEVALDTYSNPVISTDILKHISYNKFNIIKGNVDEVFTFNAHAFDDDGFINSFNWNFSNISLDSTLKNAGDFTLTNDFKVYGFNLIASDNDGNQGETQKNYILLEDKDGFQQLPQEGISDVSIAYGEVKKYYFSFPVGAVDPKIETTGTGDVDLFISYLNGPAVSYNLITGDYEFPYSTPLLFSSTSADGSESINLASPLKEDGIWCIQVYGWENNPMTFSLTATYKEPAASVAPETTIVCPNSGNLTIPVGTSMRFSGNGTAEFGLKSINWEKDSVDLGEGLSKDITFNDTGNFVIKATAVDRQDVEDATPAEVNVNVVSSSTYPQSIFCPLVYEDNVYGTELYLLNLSDTVNTAIILALDDHGSIISSKTVSNMAVGEKKMFDVGDIFSGIEFVTGVKIISESPINGFVRVKTKAKGDKQGSAVFVKNYESIVVPHIHEIKTTEHQWGTTFGLISNESDDVSFNYFSDTLDNMKGNYTPFSKKERFYSFFDKNMPTNQMWGIFSSSKKQGIAGMEMFEKVDGNQQQTILSLSDDTFTELYLAHIDITAGWWTGLSLVNPSAIDANVTITAYASDGTQLVETSFTVLSEGRKVDLIGNFFDSEVPENIAWVKVVSNTGLTGYEIFGYVNNEQIAGINVIGNLTDNLTFMHVSNDSTPWTGIAVLNPTGNSVNVTFTGYGDDGEVVGTPVSMAINSKSKYVGLVSGLFSGETGISYIKAESNGANSICGFELFGTTSQVYLNGIEAVSMD